jgi:hypothetical protein
MAAVLFAGQGAAPARADEPTALISIKDHQFHPSEVEIPAGVKVKLIVRNGDSTPEEFESAELHREKVVPPGSDVNVYVGPLRPGRYEFFGDFNPKTARGFLVVK